MKRQDPRRTLVANEVQGNHIQSIIDMLHVFDGDEAAYGEFEYEAFKAARRAFYEEVEQELVTVETDEEEA